MATPLKIRPLGVIVWGAVGYLLGGPTGALVGAGLDVVAQAAVDDEINRVIKGIPDNPWVAKPSGSPAPVQSRGYSTPGGLGY